ncbi:hypothetical protein DT075_27840 [Bacillus licheniformis]|nr:hypothetical protein DT075_27840 [Bacillus licheniformis]
MSIKKLVIPILAAALLTMGISVVSATDQSDGVYQIAYRDISYWLDKQLENSTIPYSLLYLNILRRYISIL